MLLQRIFRGIAASRLGARSRRARTLIALLAAAASVTCSVDELTFTLTPVTIGGTVTGLEGAGLVLINNGGDELAIAEDGVFTFSTPLERGASYALAVKRQPSNPTQVCSITNGNGTTGDDDVIDVQVSCHTATLRIGGTVTGLAGSGLVLQNNAGDSLPVSADGTFTFATPVPSGASYDVTVAMQPALPTQECIVTNGQGIVGTSDVTNVVVTCTTRSFTIGGTVTGLVGTGLVLQNNGGDDLAIGADGSFKFATPIASGATFTVTVLAQPSGRVQTCTVGGGTGTVGGGDVTSVAVNCTTNRYMIGGTVSGLTGTVTLQNTGGDDLDVTANGMFAFATSVPSGTTYDVTVRTQPTQPSQTCRVTAGAGTVTNADITSVVVICTTNLFKIGGTLSGLALNNSITLRNNGGDDLPLSADGVFELATPVLSGQPYAVTLVADPTTPVSQECTVTNGTGIVGGSDVTDVMVTCSTNAFTIGGTVTGLGGSGLVLQNNGGDDLAIGADGSFTFATPVASGAPFEVTVLAQPAGPAQTCTVAGGTGTVGAGDVTSVVVTCTTNRYTIGGTITGLVGSGLVLQNSGGDDLAVTADGPFVFSTPVLSGEDYAVTVLAQPTAPAQTCTVTAGTGTVTSADVTSVVVTCTTNRYTIGGTLTGLAPGNSLMLRNNGGDHLVLSANGSFTFATPVASGQTYDVSPTAHPTTPIAQTCTVAAGTGTVTNADVTSVIVTCTTNRYTIGGTLAGLAAGNSITLRNNGGDNLALSTNGNFTFATPVPSGQPYAVTIVANPTSPIAQTCTVTNGTGVVGSSNITNVQVTCTTNHYSIGGTLSGLAPGNSIRLRNNGVDELVRSLNGNFTFSTPVPSGAPYAVTVVVNPTSPVAQTCTVMAGSGMVTSADITNIVVTCTTNRYSISGTLTGLAPGNSLRLRNNGGDDLVVSASGGFTFATTMASGLAYAVTIAANPASPISQTCTVNNGTGVVGGSNVTDVQVGCTTDKFTIGGTVSGLIGTGLVLQNNGGDDLTLNANGTFTFPTPVASGATYEVTIRTQPSGEPCRVTDGTGTVGASDVTSVEVSCGIWKVSQFPISVPGNDNGAGDLAFDNNGDLLVAVSRPARAIVRVNRVTGARTTVAANIGSSSSLLFGVTYRAANDMIYASTNSGQIFAVTPAGTVTPLTTISAFINAITIAPPSFGSFGGFIICVTQSGSIIAVNPSNGAVTTITATAGPASDLAFAPDGTLYISGAGTVRKVTDTGVVTTFASGFASADGITITPDGARMFIADSGPDIVYRVMIPGAAVTPYGSANIDDGSAVGGVLAAPGGTLIVMTGESNLTLIAFPY